MNSRMKLYYIDEKLAEKACKAGGSNTYVEGVTTRTYQEKVVSLYKLISDNESKFNGKNLSKLENIYELANTYSEEYANWINFYNAVKCYNRSTNKQLQDKMYEDIYKQLGKVTKIREKIAQHIRGTNRIRTEDEDAISKLEERLDEYLKIHQDMKEANAYYRKNKTMVGYKNLDIETAKEMDREIEKESTQIKRPYPNFVVSNHGKEVRRIQGRIQYLKKLKENPIEEKDYDFFKVVKNIKIMRLYLILRTNVTAEIMIELKQRGFHRSKEDSNCWERKLTPNAEQSLSIIVKKLLNEEE